MDNIPVSKKGNISALTGFVLAIVSGLILLAALIRLPIGSAYVLIPHFSILAIIFSIIGLIQTREKNKKDRFLAVIGLVLGIVEFVFFILKSVLLF